MSPAASWGEWLAFVDAAGRFLFLNWAVQATGLLGAALLVSRLPRVSPAARHAVLAAALLVAAATPLLHFLPPASPGRATPAPVARMTARVERSLGGGRASAQATPHTRRPTPGAEAPWGVFLLVAWAGLAGARLLSLAHGAWSVSRWRGAATAADRGRAYDACGYTVADIPVLESGAVTVPSVIGLVEPAILLPRGLMASLELPALRHVLLHEEAHVRRRDPLALFLAALAHALLFWHPLAGMVRRRMETTAEDACDARVLNRGVDGAGYARTLLSVLEHSAVPTRRSPVCPLGGAGSELQRRVLQILSGGPPVSPGMTAVAAGALVAVGAPAAVLELGARPVLPHGRPTRRMMAAAPALEPLPQPRRRVEAPRSKPAAKPQLAVAAPLAGAAGLTSSLAAIPGGEAPLLADSRAPLPRESRCVVFLLDTSNSMRPYREAAQRQILELAQALSPGDRFNVIAFSAEVTQFAEQPVIPNEDGIAGARAWLEGLANSAGTDVAAGLTRALQAPEVTSVVLVSDGEASSNAADRTRLAALIGRENRSAAQVLTLTLGLPAESESAPLTALSEPKRGDIEAEQGVGELRP